MDKSSDAATLFVDGHVHWYPSYDVDAFLDHAVDNLEHAARRVGRSQQASYSLLLADRPEQHTFSDLLHGRGKVSRWRLSPLADGISIWCECESRPAVLLCAGRQVVTREGLEVLALCSDTELESGRSIQQTVECAIEADGVTVLPWGVGKWMGSRRDVIEGMLQECRPRDIFVGDNGNRLAMAPRPRILDRAVTGGFTVLAGSDPLELSAHIRRVGSFGFSLLGRLSNDQGARDLATAIRNSRQAIQTFGKCAGVLEFGRSQVAAQMLKRMTGPTG